MAHSRDPKLNRPATKIGQAANTKPEDYKVTSCQPLHALVFLLPLLVGYEVGLIAEGQSLLAEQMIRQTLTFWTNGTGMVGLSGLVVVAVLLGRHIDSGNSWRIQYRVLGLMAVEVIVLSLPLFFLHWLIPKSLTTPRGPPPPATQIAPHSPHTPVFPRLAVGEHRHVDEPLTSLALVPQRRDQDPSATPSRLSPATAPCSRDRLRRDMMISLGAGPYEEFLFRLLLLNAMVWLLSELAGTGLDASQVVAVLVAATLFAGYHHLPGSAESFTWGGFLFRTAAGVYFGFVYLWRGYAIAAGCHTGYDVMVDFSRHW